MFGGIASTSLRYIASGLSTLAPIGNATVGDAGLTRRSNSSSAARNSSRMIVRTFCAWP
jgi:hypothetical protein